MSKYKVDNEELKDELVKYIDSCEFMRIQNKKGEWKTKIKKRGQVSEKLGQMVKTISEGLATKGNWRGYTWKEDMISFAILITLKYFHNFNHIENNNAHGYINRICSNAFLQYVQKEKSHSNIKKELYEKKEEVQSKWDESIDYKSLKDDEVKGELLK